MTRLRLPFALAAVAAAGGLVVWSWVAAGVAAAVGSIHCDPPATVDDLLAAPVSLWAS